ncbi:hypothetical protein FNQ90_10790, partial [Streptomyces alkaliphilus]|nr:hypothetical protein [Streptomyces alkaliphilus]
MGRSPGDHIGVGTEGEAPEADTAVAPDGTEVPLPRAVDLPHPACLA